MAKFCSQCGKQLEEGEICSCTAQQQTATEQSVQNQAAQGEFVQTQGQNAQGQTAQGQFTQPQSNQFINPQQINTDQLTKEAKNAITDVVDLVKSPVGKLVELSKEKKGMVYGAIFAGIQVFICTLIAVILMIFIHISLGDAASYLPKLPYVQFPLLVLILTAASAALTALFLYVFDNKVFHGDASFGSMLTVVGAKSIVSVVCMLVGAVLCILSSGIGILFIIMGIMLSLAYMAVAYSRVTALDADKAAFVLMIVVAIMTIIDVIFIRMTLSSIVSSIASYISSIGNILNIFS